MSPGGPTERAALIVDDAPELRVALRWMLGGAGFDVDEADDGAVEEAFTAAGVTTFFEKTQFGELVDWAERAG